MLDTNVDRVMAAIEPHHLVLDIGGWARPFNRANWVLDAEPFDTRGYYGANRPAQGGDREFFTKDTWVVRDICEHTPYPFADKQFDYVTCSHVLEDVRDPLWVCSEMRRIAKRGYIEMPSREAESCRGTEPNQVGWSHHRWYHRIHSHWRLSFPSSHLRSLSQERQVQWLFWDDCFDFEELTIHGVDNIEAHLAAYVQTVRPYPQVVVDIDRALRRATHQVGRAGRWAKRQLSTTGGGG
jgi:hypothetical protein